MTAMLTLAFFGGMFFGSGIGFCIGLWVGKPDDY